MKNLPDTGADRIVLTARNSDEQLSIIVVGDPEQYRQLWTLAWSYDEKPYPVGGFEVRIPGANPLTLFRFAITEPGYGVLPLGVNGPIFTKGFNLEFILHGNSASKELVVVLR